MLSNRPPSSHFNDSTGLSSGSVPYPLSPSINQPWPELAAPPNSPTRGPSPTLRHSKRSAPTDLDDLEPISVRPRKRRNSLGWEPRLEALTLTQDSPSFVQTKISTISLPSVVTPLSEQPLIPLDEEYSTSEDEHLLETSGNNNLTFHPALLDRLNRISKGPAEDLGLQLDLHPRSEMALVLYRPLLPPGVQASSGEEEKSDEDQMDPEPVISHSWQTENRKVSQESEGDEMMDIDD